MEYTTFYFITAIILIHYFADFICQPRRMAKNKGKDIIALLAHVYIYSLVSWFCYESLIFGLFNWGEHYSELSALCLAYLLITHFGVDYITSKINVRLYKKGNMKMFWNTVGLDQAIHLISIFGFFAWVGRFI